MESSKDDIKNELSDSFYNNENDNKTRSHRTRERMFRVRNILNTDHTRSVDDINPHNQLHTKVMPEKYDRKQVFTNDFKNTVFKNQIQPKT